MNLFRKFNALNINFYFRLNTKRLIGAVSNNNNNQLIITAQQQKYPPKNRFPTNKRNFVISSILSEDKIIKTPPFAESVTEGDIRWSKKIGDKVAIDEIIGEIETDKTAIPIHSPSAGVILELYAADGDKVVANQDLLKLQIGPEAIAADKSTEKSVEHVKIEEKPPAKSLVNEKLIKEIKPSEKPPKTDKIPSPWQPLSTSGNRGEQRVKINRMRLRIAQRLKDAQNTCAMLTTFNECDMSAVMDMRARYQEQFSRKHGGVKLGFMSAFIRGVCSALQEQPVVNAVIDGPDIVYRDYIDISVAVATPKGLVVPVLRDVDRMASLGDIERSLAELGERARLGQLAVEDMEGGTFTISNGGVFGSLLGTPIINPPQSAILGVHAIQQRPVAIDGRVEIRPMMYLALTYDHRLIDGREAVLFLRKVKAVVEDPRVALLGL